MKAVVLAGGFGTRLRPLTLNTPKPIVPIFDRPFLYQQIELLRQLPDIDEIILSLNYQPEAIERVVGDGSDLGIHIRYVVEPTPLGTGGAVKYACHGVQGTVIVFNGDVLTDTDLGAVVALHQDRQARATIVLTPVENPSAYGLVETDNEGNVTQFLEKPNPDEITCDTINAGIYVLDTDTFDRIPDATNWSIERQFFPSLVERRETFVAHVDRGYWLDIGTPDKYVQAHRDIMAGRCRAYPFAGRQRQDPARLPRRHRQCDCRARNAVLRRGRRSYRGWRTRRAPYGGGQRLRDRCRRDRRRRHPVAGDDTRPRRSRDRCDPWSQRARRRARASWCGRRHWRRLRHYALQPPAMTGPAACSLFGNDDTRHATS